MTDRLQKILSARGIASRRAAEKMIEEGRVTVNGVLASVGALLIFGKDAFLIPAMAVIITLLCVFRGKIEEVAK
jgi:ribosomal protein S4